MIYPEQPEIILSSAQLRLLIRLLRVMSIDQVEQFVISMEEIASNGHGMVTVKIYRGHPRFIERTFTDDMRE